MPKKLFAGIPEKERFFLLHALHAANEINVLVKLFQYTSQGPEDGLIARANMVQALTIGRVITGKLSNASTLIHQGYIQAGLDKIYNNDLGPEAAASVSNLMAYFADRDNLITTVRDGFASHYDTGRLKKHFDTAPENDHWEIILAPHHANTLYFAPEIVLLHAMVSEIHAGNRDEAFAKLMDDTAKVAGWFNNFVIGFLIVATEKHLGGFAQLDSNSQLVEIPDALAFYDLKVPFFTEVRPEDRLKGRGTK
ncbi:hypothetical protein BB934_12385 [Microvirga ossetica]|uniref:Uncharacterized protein n=2 Tax=Microvirga ossetica TaxID=1882682 RepID=A0A1B2EG11_9HYPH|nr:hypothetical protein BB934_12385 [Microvirga ossetica]